MLLQPTTPSRVAGGVRLSPVVGAQPSAWLCLDEPKLDYYISSSNALASIKSGVSKPSVN